MLSRRKWVVLLSALLLATVFFFGSYLQTKQYEASAQLIYENSVDVANPLSSGYVDPNLRSVELQSVPTVISSPELEKRAETMIVAEGGEQALEPGYEVSAQIVSGAADQAAGVTTYSSVVAIVAQSQRAGTWQRWPPTAYADALIAVRKERQQKQITEAIDVVEGTLRGMTTPGRRPRPTTSCCSSDCMICRFSGERPTEASASLSQRRCLRRRSPPKPIRSAVVGLFVGSGGRHRPGLPSRATGHESPGGHRRRRAASASRSWRASHASRRSCWTTRRSSRSRSRTARPPRPSACFVPT